MARGAIRHTALLVLPHNVDADTAYLKFTPSAPVEHQSIFYTDSATETFHLTPITVLEFINNDEGTIPLKLTASALEEAAIGDSGTKRLALTPSAPVEGLSWSDSATEYFKFTPSAPVETVAHIYLDAGTVYLALTPATAAEHLYHFCGAPSENYRLFTVERWRVSHAVQLPRHVRGVKRWYGSATTC